MRWLRMLVVAAVTWMTLLAVNAPADAVSPRNPYRSFNLSGVNYGSMQWERAQRQGKRVWPYYNTPSRRSARGTTIVRRGVAGGSGSQEVVVGRSTSSGASSNGRGR